MTIWNAHDCSSPHAPTRLHCFRNIFLFCKPSEEKKQSCRKIKPVVLLNAWALMGFRKFMMQHGKQLRSWFFSNKLKGMDLKFTGLVTRIHHVTDPPFISVYTHQIMIHQQNILSYCWWFRNPVKKHLGCEKNNKHGINYLQYYQLVQNFFHQQ